MLFRNRHRLKRWTSEEFDKLDDLHLQRFPARYSYSATNWISTNFSFQIPVWVYASNDILLIVPQKLNFFQSLFTYLVPLLLTNEIDRYSSFSNAAYIVTPEEIKVGDKFAITFTYRLSGLMKAVIRGHLMVSEQEDLVKIRLWKFLSVEQKIDNTSV